MTMVHRPVIVLALAAQLVSGCGESLARQRDVERVSVEQLEFATSSEVRAEAEAAGLDSLDTVEVPRPTNLEEFVRNEEIALVLGKALFWDQQVGSDGQACASCHFHAGADNRTKNQLSPGLLVVDDDDRDDLEPDDEFGNEEGLTNSGEIAGPNYRLERGDFPFHELEDPNDRHSCVDDEDNDGDGLEDFEDPDCFDMNDIASSQGTFDGPFIAVDENPATFGRDICGDLEDPIFNVNGIEVRRVEPRHTPSTINAVFNHRNFWDGRANNIFNGLNPFGERGLLGTDENPNPGTLVLRDGEVVKEQVRIDNASLASQAVGPPLNDLEMSCAGRTWADIGHKLLPRRPLANQFIHPNDSVLGQLRDPSGRGLVVTYRDLVREAFEPRYWAAGGDFDPNGDPVDEGEEGFTQAEVNFSLFFGLAVQIYESTLIADETPFDDFMRGDDQALTEVQQFGLEIFIDEGRCVNCHDGPELTGASVRLRAEEPFGNEQAVERMIMGDGEVALYDGGFYNIGVRPTFEDIGLGGEILGFPISFSRQLAEDDVIDDFEVNEESFEVPGEVEEGDRVAVDGAFKAPHLRNVELNGPYFHNGGNATLRQVVDFYDRGGDRIDLGNLDMDFSQIDGDDDCDTTGFEDQCSNLDPDIQRLGLDEIVREIDGEQVTASEALVEFMLALTDERVRHNAAPFDHPQLFVPNGHVGDQQQVVDDGDGEAVQQFRVIPATGAEGGEPIQPFLRLDPHQP